MGYIVQGQWQFINSNITGSTPTFFSFSLAPQAGTTNFVKLIASGANVYVTPGSASSLTPGTGFYVPKDTILDFNPSGFTHLTAVASGTAPSCNGVLSVAYYSNIQLHYK